MGWAINSVVECYLHTVEVTGSNPVSPTTSSHSFNVSYLIKKFLSLSVLNRQFFIL